FFFQAEDGIRDGHVTGVQTCALPIWEEQVDVVDNETRNAEGETRNSSGNPEHKRVIYVFNKADLLPDPETFLTGVREQYPHAVRSEERRVGKECRSRMAQYH